MWVHRSVNRCHVPQCSHWPRADIRTPCEDSSGTMFSPSLSTVDDSARIVWWQRENASPRSYFQLCGNSILHRVTAVHLRPFQSVLTPLHGWLSESRSSTTLRRLCVTTLLTSCWQANRVQTMFARVQMSTPDGTTIPDIDVRPAVGRHTSAMISGS